MSLTSSSVTETPCPQVNTKTRGKTVDLSKPGGDITENVVEQDCIVLSESHQSIAYMYVYKVLRIFWEDSQGH